MCYGLEVDMIAKAREKDMLTTPYVFSADGSRGDGEGRRRHHRLPSGPDHRRLDRRADRARSWKIAPRGSTPGPRPRSASMRDIIVLAHGGPIAEPADADFIIKNTRNCHGFYGASSMERLPVEVALTEQVRKFKAIGARLKRRDGRGRETMSGNLVGEFILWLIVAIVAIAIVVYMVNWLYHRSSKEVSFVRTGLLGERVVINGGAFVLPFIHDNTPVNMNVLPMGVVRSRQDARHHPGPHARRHRGRLLRPRAGDRAKPCRSPPRRSAGAPWSRSSFTRCLSGKFVSAHPLGRLRNDHGGDARAARRICRARQGRRRRGAGAERPRAGIGRDHRSRPDRSRISSTPRTASTPKA